MNPESLFALALQHHHAGRLAEAEVLYRQVLAAESSHADALHHLGAIAHQVGRHDLAIDLIRRAIQRHPGSPEACLNLGNALSSRGRNIEAIASYRRALELRPGFAEAANSLGTAQAALGQIDKAMSSFRQAVALQPDYPEAFNNLGNVLQTRAQWDEAFAAYGEAIRLRPDYPDAHANMGVALAEQGRHREALAEYRRALELNPQSAEAYGNLGLSLATLGLIDEAETAHRRALEINPGYADACNSLAQVLKEQGRLEEAFAAYREALRLNPEQPGVHSNLIYTLLFRPIADSNGIAEEQRRWCQRFVTPLRPSSRSYFNTRDPERRLRIGYVSPNFHRHSISHFLIPLLEAHDPAQVEIHCYASVKRPDDFTARARKSARVWCDVLALDDRALAELISHDRIDILVDLTQHMANNRLAVFARQPAPVQVSWLGYPATTGLPIIDYRLTDAWMEPEGAPWTETVEHPVRLPDCWFCFDPLTYLEPIVRSATVGGPVTFGSLNNFCKINEPTLQLWAAVLRTTEGSRLLLHCPVGRTQSRLRQYFEGQGVSADRLELVPHTATREDYLRLWERIDVGLDPFPYNGGTTTCEALWMGTPVVSLAGQTAVSRLGLSILKNLGLPELVASSEQEYIRIATELAHDAGRRRKMRSTLRDRMQASPLMDAPRFARNVEAAYRTMWREWCSHPA